MKIILKTSFLMLCIYNNTIRKQYKKKWIFMLQLFGVLINWSMQINSIIHWVERRTTINSVKLHCVKTSLDSKWCYKTFKLWPCYSRFVVVLSPIVFVSLWCTYCKIHYHVVVWNKNERALYFLPHATKHSIL